MRLALALLLAFICFPTLAQPPATEEYKLRFVDTQGMPIPGLHIQWESDSLGIGITNAEGYIILQATKETEITVMPIGFAPSNNWRDQLRLEQLKALNETTEEGLQEATVMYEDRLYYTFYCCTSHGADEHCKLNKEDLYNESPTHKRDEIVKEKIKWF